MSRAVLLTLVVISTSCGGELTLDGGLSDDGGLTTTYTVTGTVVGPGKTNAALSLQAEGVARTATSDESGRYQFIQVANGNYTLTAGQHGFEYSPSSQFVQVASSDVLIPQLVSVTVQTRHAVQAFFSVSGTVSGDVKASVVLTLVGNGNTHQATTDPLGVYSVADVTAGTYALTPSLSGYTFAPPSLMVTITEADVPGQEFTATADTFAVSGTVSGEVKAGVTITLIGIAKTFQATTDAAGAFSLLDVTAGTYTLTPSLTGYEFTPATRTVTVTGAAITAQDFTATAVPNAVSGTVGGDVKTGVVLTLVGNGKTLEATTDATGAFRVADATAGTYTLTPSLTGYTFFPASLSMTILGAAISGQDFAATALPFAVSGTVGGDVNAGVVLTLEGNGKTLQATSDDTGAFAIPDATVGTYTLTPSLAGYAFSPASRTVTVAGAAISGQDFTATAVPNAVSGTVGGDVKSGVVLTLEGNGKTLQATTDASGAFTVADATVGTYTLTPRITGYAFTPASRTVTVLGSALPGQDFTAMAVRYVVGGTVGGDVKTGVVLTLEGNGKTLQATTDDSGAFSLEDATVGTYTLTPSLAGYAFSPASRTVTVAGAAISGQDFTATAVPNAVSGTVGGDVKSGVVLTLEGNGKTLQATTDASGAFTVADATVGTYTLTPRITGYAFTPASRTVTVLGSALPGQDFTAMAVRYVVGGTVGGDVKTGVVLTLEGNGKTLQATTDDSGAFSLEDATVGTYTLTPSLAGYAFSPATLTVTVAGAAISGQDFTATAVPNAVSGTVGGDVKAGVVLTLVGNGKTLQATTDASGAFTVADATVGTYTLTSRLTGYAFTPASRTVTVLGSAVPGQDFTATAVRYVVGGSVGGDAKAGVVLTLVGNGKSLQATTDATGAFTLPDATIGTYTLMPSLARHTFTPASRTVTVSGVALPGQDFNAKVDTYAVNGIVSGEAPAGVLLTLTRSGTTPKTSSTANGGAFRFDGLLDGTYSLTPSLVGYTFAPPTRTVTVDGAAATALGFTASAVPYAVGGTVRGSVIEGVVLTLVGNGKSLQATTDASGTFTVPDATVGTYMLTPKFAGYAFTPATRTVTVAGAAVRAQDFNATAVPYAVGGTVRGSVKEGVVLTLVGNGKSLQATSDDSGGFSVTDATAGTYTLTPSLVGYTFSPATRAVTVVGNAVSGQDFTATAVLYAVGGSVSGGVKAGVRVTLEGNGKILHATTNASGTFSMPHATVGTYTLTPYLAGYAFSPANRTVTVDGAAVLGQDFIATSVPFSVGGTVSGDEKAGVVLTLLRNGKTLQVISDVHGVFFVDELPGGIYTLTPSLAGYSFAPPKRTVSIFSSALLGQDFTATAVPHTVSGTVSGDVKARVVLTLVGNGKRIRATTNSSGVFTVEGATMGTYTLTPSRDGYTFYPESRTVVVAEAPIDGQDFTTTKSPAGSDASR